MDVPIRESIDELPRPRRRLRGSHRWLAPGQIDYAGSHGWLAPRSNWPRRKSPLTCSEVKLTTPEVTLTCSEIKLSKPEVTVDLLRSQIDYAGSHGW